MYGIPASQTHAQPTKQEKKAQRCFPSAKATLREDYNVLVIGGHS